jgi:stage II sporulation protein D
LRFRGSRKLALSATLFVAIESHAAIPPVRAPLAGEETMEIRVRVSAGVPVVALRGFDLRIHDRAKARIAAAPGRQSQWEIRCFHGQIRASRVDGEAELELKGPVAVQTPAGFLHFQGRPFRGELVIHAGKGGCEVVNQVPLEKYLDGLVNSEFSSKWGEGGIAAQVIAARTYAYYQMQESQAKDRHWDVESDERDQVYDGSLKEDFRSSRAVEKTRGVILAVNESGAFTPLKAFYHSTCGGVTDVPSRVWGTHYPGFKRVKCPYCYSSPRYRWELELTSTEVKRLIVEGAADEAKALGWPSDWKRILKTRELVEVATDEPEGGGRATRVILRFSNGKAEPIELVAPAPRFRVWLGTANLRSTSFQAAGRVKGSLKLWRFEGKGNGHGVGMCQWGAKVMSEMGMSARKILKHYYPAAVLKKLW